MSNDEVNEIMKLIKFKSYPETKGGQSCGSPKGLTLISEELGLELSCIYYRSQNENREYLLKCIKLLIEEL